MVTPPPPLQPLKSPQPPYTPPNTAKGDTKVKNPHLVKFKGGVKRKFAR